MKKYSIKTFAVVAFLFVVFVFLSIALWNFKEENAMLKDASIIHLREIYSLKKNYLCNYSENSKALSGITNVDGNIVPTESFFNDNDSVLLVCRISENYCSGCNHYAVNLAKSLGYSRTIFLNNRIKKQSFRNLQLSFNFCDSTLYGLEDMLTETDKIFHPYFVVISPSCMISTIYIPTVGNQHLDFEMLMRISKQIK